MMLIVFLAGLHGLFLSIYAIAIELRKSRHQHIYLAYAACLPFVGELCLLISEFGKTESEYDVSSVFYFMNCQNDTQQKKVDPIAIDNMEITREILLNAIETSPSNLVEILKKGLNANDVEVVHVSAATIMKIQREYENNIKKAAEKYAAFPENMTTIKEYIGLIGAFYSQNLLYGESATLLLQQQEELLYKLLNVLPEDEYAAVTLINNYAKQNRIEDALRKATTYRLAHYENYVFWEICAYLLDELKKIDEIRGLFDAAQPMMKNWTAENQQKWNYLYEELISCKA